MKGIFERLILCQNSYDDIFLCLARLHEYLDARQSLTEPDDQSFNPFTWTHGQDGKPFWDVMAEKGKFQRFQMALANMSKAMPVTGFFDFGTLATADDRVVLVDVGGGMGVTLKAILNSNEQLTKMPEKFVLQDLKGPVEQAKASGQLPQGVQAMEHNIMSEQPIKGMYIVSMLYSRSNQPRFVNALCRRKSILSPPNPPRLLGCSLRHDSWESREGLLSRLDHPHFRDGRSNKDI